MCRQENYWFRRHLVVYEWIAARAAGLRVIDMACGEGYGSACSRTAPRRWSAWTPTRRPTSTRACAIARRTCALSATSSRGSRRPPSAVVFLQTIEHVENPGEVLAHFRSLVGDGVVYVSTPNVLTLAPAGTARSDNPWHVDEYRAQEFAALCRASFTARGAASACSTRGVCARTSSRLRLGWDAAHSRLGLTERFYRRFTPAISARDFRLRAGDQARLERALDFLAVCRA